MVFCNKERGRQMFFHLKKQTLGQVDTDNFGSGWIAPRVFKEQQMQVEGVSY